MQWRCFLIPDYSETESIFVYKVHHSVADGLALVMMFFNLTDEPDIKEFPSLTLRFAAWQKVLIHLCVPFMILLISLKQLFITPRENNGVKNTKTEGNMSSLKKYAISRDIPID